MTRKTSQTAGQALPPLFTQPEVVHPSHHGMLHYSAPADDTFARPAHALPLVYQEVVTCAATLPVLFVRGAAGWEMVALTGVRQGESACVNSLSRWQGYRPAYLQLYPFTSGEVPEGEALLCLDRGYAGLTEVGGDGTEALFTPKGEPTAWLQRMQRSVANWRQARAETGGIVGQLDAAGLLKPGTAQMAVPGADAVTLDGFSAVDPAALAALPPAALAALRDAGGLEIAYAHLLSLQHLPALAARVTA